MSFMSFTSSGVFDDADAVNLSSFDFCEIKVQEFVAFERSAIHGCDEEA